MKIAMNYADSNFKKQQKHNTKTAYEKGKFDLVIEYGPEDLEENFKKKYEHILKKPRGGGYWLWKPYLILKTLQERSKEGDYLFYCDSGAYYINKIDYLINTMEKNSLDIMLFELPLIEKQWTKRDAFILMDCDNEKTADSNQISATYILIKKDRKTLEFIKEYLKYCSDERILTDLSNTQKMDNYKDYIEHRHDQSILSLLAKKNGIQGFRDPSQYGEKPWEYALYNRIIRYKRYETSDYPRILMSIRKADMFSFKVKEYIKDILLKWRMVRIRI